MKILSNVLYKFLNEKLGENGCSDRRNRDFSLVDYLLKPGQTYATFKHNYKIVANYMLYMFGHPVTTCYKMLDGATRRPNVCNMSCATVLQYMC